MEFYKPPLVYYQTRTQGLLPGQILITKTMEVSIHNLETCAQLHEFKNKICSLDHCSVRIIRISDQVTFVVAAVRYLCFLLEYISKLQAGFPSLQRNLKMYYKFQLLFIEVALTQLNKDILRLMLRVIMQAYLLPWHQHLFQSSCNLTQFRPFQKISLHSLALIVN